MLFNTLQFWVFFAFVLCIYSLLRRKAQNAFLLIASYFFYACWDWRFLGLLLISSTTDWFLGNAIASCRGTRRAKHWVAVSVTLNLLFLGFFKYFNFFVGVRERAADGSRAGPDPLRASTSCCRSESPSTRSRRISYTSTSTAARSSLHRTAVDFALFVAFFPQLVAGPIVRAERPAAPDAARPEDALGRTCRCGLQLLRCGACSRRWSSPTTWP